MKVLAAGLLITLALAGLLFMWLGKDAVFPVVVMGGVATLIEIIAVRALRKGLGAPKTTEFFKGVGVGMLLRLAGVAVFAGLAFWDRELFPAIPTALGFIGVLIPLLFLEVRLAR